jgi:O-antigen/teichoic acid export membrane protein
MFVVTPFLASNQNYFGIYTFVLSLNLFLSYADFGFLNAGIKFASEAFARDNRDDEERILGFVCYILCIVFILFGLVILFFYFHPTYLLKGLKSADDIKVAKELFLAFTISLPIVIAQRSIQLIFNIRLKDYLFQRVYSIFNILKILSVFLFFTNGLYNIVGYYIFVQLCTLSAVVTGFFIAKKQFNYKFSRLFRAIKYNPVIYKKTKGLAFNSLFVTISWIIYYELDSLVIGKFVGLKEVAIFSVCISIMTLARSLYGILYNPFTAKFNHFIGRNEEYKLEAAYKKILIIGLPFSLIPTTVLILTMKGFVKSWVGIQYLDAVPIISIMFASYYLNFLSNPTSIAMVALQRIKDLYIISAILPVIYWIGIIISYQYLGLLSFSLFKLISFAISAAFYLYYSNKMFVIKWGSFFVKNVLPGFVTVIALIFLSHIFNNWLPDAKGKSEFIKFVIIALGYTLVGMATYYSLSKDLRKVISEIYIGLTG